MNTLKKRSKWGILELIFIDRCNCYWGCTGACAAQQYQRQRNGKCSHTRDIQYIWSEQRSTCWQGTGKGDGIRYAVGGPSSLAGQRYKRVPKKEEENTDKLLYIRTNIHPYIRTYAQLRGSVGGEIRGRAGQKVDCCKEMEIGTHK